MASNASFAEIASLAGDPARAGMLHALMDGRALTASELARVAGVTPQTASGHLARMTAAGLLAVEKQGRHRYHRLASPAVAQMMESIMQVASALEATRPPPVPARAMRRCGRRAPATTTSPDGSASRSRTRSSRADTPSWHATPGLVTDAGIALFARLGIDVAALSARRGNARAFCAGPASTGANGGRISAAPSARRCARLASRRLDPPRRGHARGRGHAAGRACFATPSAQLLRDWRLRRTPDL